MATERMATVRSSVATAQLHWDFWRPLVDCKLCRSTAFPVFMLILAIESIILIPSALYT